MTQIIPNVDLDQVVDALNQGVEALGGEEAALEVFDRYYEGEWRNDESEPVAEYLKRNNEDLDNFQNQVWYDLYNRTEQEEIQKRKPEYDAPDYEFDDYYDSLGYLFEAWEDDKTKDAIREQYRIREDDRVVAIVNYKGEGEGEAIERFVKHLSIFRSKGDSFNDVI